MAFLPLQGAKMYYTLRIDDCPGDLLPGAGGRSTLALIPGSFILIGGRITRYNY